MARKKKTSIRDIKLVYRRSPELVKVAVLVAIVLCTVTLLSLRSSLHTQQEKMQQLRQDAIQLEQENEAVKKDMAELGTVDSVKKIASRELGLADPNTTFFCPAE